MGIGKDLYTKIVLAPLADYLKNEAKGDLSKNDSNMGALLRDRMPFSNPYPTNRTKPGAGIPFDALRRFAWQYDIARGAINRRKRQLNTLDWDIVAADKNDETDYSEIIKPLKKEFAAIGGYRVRFRELLDVMVEDLLTLDALAIYKRPTVGGGLYALQPVDAATIILEVDEAGGTPMPPEIAYTQMIRGKKVAEFTADEMYYEMLNPRTYTPYGLSPLESLVIGVSAALKSEVFNLNMLTEGNIPEGFFGVPKDWSPDQIKEFQALWDAALSGDTRATSKLKFVPSGDGATGYAPAVKPEDMRYEKFQEWLMKKTCMLFEMPPSELGFSMDVNRANGEVQREAGLNAGLKPLANFFQEIFTDVIQQDLGYENLKFKFNGLDSKDEKEEAEIAEIKIRSGQVTVDEVRQDRGEKPLGIDRPFILGKQVIYLDEPVDKPVDNSQTDPVEPVDKSATDPHVQLVTELRTFRKYAIGRAKAGKSLRKFESSILPAPVTDELNARLSKAADADAIRDIFSEYMRDYQINFLAETINLKGSLEKLRSS